MAKEILGSGLFTIGFDGNLSGLNAYKQGLSQLQGPVKQVGLAFNSINKGTQNLTFNIKNAATHTQGMSRSMNAFAKEMFFTSTAINAINVALIGLNKGIAEVSFGFDRNMTLIKSVTNASKTEFEDLGKLARQLGSETEYGATKAAEGLLVLSRAGLNANESMLLLGPAVKLAQSQQQDMSMVTSLLISQLRVFGKTVDDSAEFSNVLAAAASKSAADLGTLGTALSYVGPIAATAGRGFEETNAALAIMFNNGLKASRIGTGLRFAMSNLINPTNKVKKAMRSLNLTQEELTPATNTLNDIFVKLADKMENVEDKAGLLFNLFGQRASTAMGTVINTVIRNRDAFQQMQDSITDTDEVTRQYEQQLNSFSGSALLLKSRIQDVGISLGENLMPAMRMAIESLTSLTEWFKGLSDGTKENIGKVLLMTTVTTTLAGAFTGLMWVGGMLGKALTGMAKGYGALGAAVWGTWKSFQANQAAIKAQIALLPTVDAALKKVVFTEMKLFAVHANVPRSSARRKALLIQETIALQANSRAKLAAALIGARRIAQQYHLTKAQTAGLYSTIRTAAAQSTLQGAFVKTATTAGVLKGALRGITSAFGGPVGIIMTLATIAIPSFITATMNAKAKQEEAERVTKDQVQALTDLNNRLIDVRGSLEMLEGEQDKANKSKETARILAERFSAAHFEEAKVIAEIARAMPELIEGYDKERGVLIINEKKLQDYLTTNQHLKKSLVEIDKLKSGTKEERIAAIEAEIIKTKDLIAENAQFIVQQRVQLENAKELATIGVGTVQGFNRTWGANNSSSIAPTGAREDAAFNMVEYAAKVKEAEKKILELVSAEEALEAMRERLKEAKAGGDDPNEDPIADAGADAKKAAKDLEAFLLSLERLRLKLEDITRARKRDSDEAALASDIDRQLLKNTNAAMNEQADILRDLSAAREKYESLKRLKDEGKTIQAGDLEAALSKLRTLENETLRVFGAIDEKAEALNDKIIRDAVKAQGAANSKLSSSLRKLELDLRGFLDNSLSYRLEVIDQEEEAALASVDEQISILQDQLSNEEKLREGQLKNISDLEYEKVLIVKANAQKAVQAQIDALKASQSLDLLQMENSGAAPSQLIQQDIANKKEYYEKLKELKSEDHEDTMAALKELRDAEKEGIQSSLDRWDKWGSVIGDVISEVINDVDGLGEKLASSFISGGTAVVKGIASQNYAQAAAGIAEIGIAIKQFKDAVGDPSQASTAAAESLDALNASAKELQFSFIDFARELLGLGKSTEEVGMALETAINNIVKLVDYDRPGFGGVDDSSIKAILAALPTELRHALEKGGEPAFDKFMDFAKDVLSPETIDGEGGPTTYTAEALGMTPEAFSEFQKQLKAFLLRTGLADIPRRSRVGSAGLNFSESAPEGLIQALGTASATESVSNIRGELYGGLGTGSLFSTSENFINSLRGTLDALKDSAFILDGFGRSVVGYSDYLEVMNTVFEEGLANAKTEAEVNAIFAERANNLKFLAGSPLWQQVPDAEKIKFKTTVFNPDKVEADRQAAITKLQKADPAAAAITDSADKIETAFKDGAISFSEALSGLDSLEAKLGDFPTEVADALKLSLDKARLSVLTGTQRQVAAAGTSISEIQKIQENYLEALTDIDDKTKEVISTWDGLLADRRTVIDTFIQESAELKKESDARIATLEEERSATLGSFSFSDTQSVRSARFAKVGETEKKIQEETTKYYTDLIDMTVKYKEDLSTIDASVKELTDEYGTQAGVYTAFAVQRKDAETTYYDLLLKQRDALKEIGALVQGIDYTSISSLADSLVGIAEHFQGTAPAGLDETVEDLDSSIKDKQAEEALASITIPTPPSQTLTAPEVLAAPNTKTAFTKTLMPRTIMAETGFEGIVRKPTSFMTGEHNKPEFVSVTPLSGLNRLEGGMAKSSTTNIVIHESIDLRGAYGITSPQVAQKVWNNVWAPARRRAVSRIMDTRGKVQR